MSFWNAPFERQLVTLLRIRIRNGSDSVRSGPIPLALLQSVPKFGGKLALCHQCCGAGLILSGYCSCSRLWLLAPEKKNSTQIYMNNMVGTVNLPNFGQF